MLVALLIGFLGTLILRAGAVRRQEALPPSAPITSDLAVTPVAPPAKAPEAI